MQGQETIEISVLESLSQITAEEWDACACPEATTGRPTDPFSTHRFLLALEESGSVGPRTGWTQRHLVAKIEGQTIAVMPLYAKSHSQGEYVFDHSWAHAYERAGGHYYPKLQSSIPFTPATGRRFLTLPGLENAGISALAQGAIQLAANNDVSSLHVTFCTKEEFDTGGKMGLLQRVTQQFHWYNRDYPDFDAFLAELSSRKRKNIRKERKRAAAFGGKLLNLTGADIEPEHWDAFWMFYQDTGARKWGSPYLTRQFFEIAQETLRDDIYLLMAERDGRYVAGALNFIGRDALYGRYWGCVEDHPCLHFEACYYQAIEFAIKNGLSRVEAGAQGEHKLARGYLPAETYSLHWMREEGFAKAVEDYLAAERRAVGEDIEILTSYGPFKNIENEEPDG